jgi:DNA polymerase-1
VDTIKGVIIDCMQTALLLPNEVPVIAEVGIGENWLEAH